MFGFGLPGKASTRGQSDRKAWGWKDLGLTSFHHGQAGVGQGRAAGLQKGCSPAVVVSCWGSSHTASLRLPSRPHPRHLPPAAAAAAVPTGMSGPGRRRWGRACGAGHRTATRWEACAGTRVAADASLGSRNCVRSPASAGHGSPARPALCREPRPLGFRKPASRWAAWWDPSLGAWEAANPEV
jgi:hypothetical protein